MNQNLNTAPSAPSSLTSMISGTSLQLSWSGSDAETLSSAGLNYNLRIGSTSGGNDILAPMAYPLSNGYRMIPERGMFQNLTTTVNLPDGNCSIKILFHQMPSVIQITDNYTLAAFSDKANGSMAG